MSDPKVDFRYVPISTVPEIWDKVTKVLGKSIDTSKGKFFVHDVFESVMEQNYLLWVATVDDDIVAAATTRVIVYPNKQALAIDWMGGSKMKLWLPLVQKAMEDYAIQTGCSHLEGYGRKGWARWLSKYGWEPDYIAYKMELRNG